MSLSNGLRAIRAIGRLFSKSSQEDINYNFARCVPYDRITVSSPLSISSSAVGHVHLGMDFPSITSGIDADSDNDGEGTPQLCVHIGDLMGVIKCDTDGGGTVEIDDMMFPVGNCDTSVV